MPFGWIAAGSAIGGLLGGSGAKKAANKQAKAAKYAADIQYKMFSTINNQQEPYREAGYGALNKLQQFTSNDAPGSLLHRFGPEDLNANLAPNWQFALSQGQGATQNLSNKAGGLISGNAMRGIADYTINKSGDLYQQAFQNYNANQTNIFNRLSAIAGLGQTANQTTATAGTTAATNAGTAIQNAGAATAGGIVGATNAITGGINNAASWYSLPSIMNMGAANG